MTAAALFITAAVLSIVLFIIPFEKGGIFWIAYIAEILALVLQVPIFRLACADTQSLKSRVLGFPVFRVGYIFMGILRDMADGLLKKVNGMMYLI